MPLTLSDLRPEVAAFALKMEQQLRSNPAITNWKTDSARSLLDAAKGLVEQFADMMDDLTGGDPDGPAYSKEEAFSEAADVALFCMMTVDVLGGLPPRVTEPPRLLGLTEDELRQALRNVGVDLDNPDMAENFFCGPRSRELADEVGELPPLEVVREVGKEQPHVTSSHGDCVAWCPACGPQCEHGDNSLTCSKCAAGKPLPGHGYDRHPVIAEPLLSRYTAPTAFAAEGARVGLVTCKTCWASLLLDPRDDFDVLKRHTAWHDGDIE